MEKEIGDLFRTGDLVVTLKQYNPTIYYYGRVINIIDRSNESYNEYVVITGHGDLNSKVDIILKVIGEKLEYELDARPILTPFTLKKNPHDVHLRNPYKEIKTCEKQIESLKRQIEFLNKNKNLDDKLNEILN
jgi:hypothetical protein